MKKVFLVLLMFAMVTTGCAKKEKDSVTYNLDKKEMITYNYNKVDYVLADITEEDSEILTTGLFYKEGKKFVLIKKLESIIKVDNKGNSAYKFYDGKLYGVGTGDLPLIYEIELNKGKSKLNELKFDVDGKKNPFLTLIIDEIDGEKIILGGNIFIGEHSEYKVFECSLKSKKCLYDK
ncbi:MAG: hypothetical protein E7158_05140 [Firmicutes bacterium]|nr:hypothetical protein [Bacillota bacterium]